MKKSRPYWLGAAVAAIGAIWLWQGLSLPATARYAEVGPGMFPAIIGGVLIVLGGVLAWQVHRGETFEPQETEDADAEGAVSRVALIYAVAAAAIPLATMKWVGFPITAAISFFLVTKAFRAPAASLSDLLEAILRWLGYPSRIAAGIVMATYIVGTKRLPLALAIGAALGFACWYGFTALGVRLGPMFPFARLF